MKFQENPVGPLCKTPAQNKNDIWESCNDAFNFSSKPIRVKSGN